MKRFFLIFISCILLFPNTMLVAHAKDSELQLTAPSYILVEASTGTVLCEKEADVKRAPASVTKVMTMLLIFDALEEEKIHLEDQVIVSEYAASMGGSQVFLEPQEVQTVETMLKCISVASANDACVAMAEHICGSEEAFVKKMNRRAKELGMKNTKFQNCNGLDAEGHETSARDIAIMSRELITQYPQVQDYCMIWMENIIHSTRKGDSEFGLTNTNKLVKQYMYATGLKTGSTSQAKFCISATAKKDDMELIAVILGADSSKVRFNEATTLLNYGFAKCTKYTDEEIPEEMYVRVKGGKEDYVNVAPFETFTYVDTTGASLVGIKKRVELQEEIMAPLERGDQIGKIIYELDGKVLGEMPLVATKNIEKMTFKTAFFETLKSLLL